MPLFKREPYEKYKDPAVLAEVSRGLGEPMVGRTTASLAPGELLASRGI
ncbi:MAG: hypothetical protein ABI444_11490 [Candidatus Kapaibacterium sp.]